MAVCTADGSSAFERTFVSTQKLIIFRDELRHFDTRGKWRCSVRISGKRCQESERIFQESWNWLTAAISNNNPNKNRRSSPSDLQLQQESLKKESLKKRIPEKRIPEKRIPENGGSWLAAGVESRALIETLRLWKTLKRRPMRGRGGRGQSRSWPRPPWLSLTALSIDIYGANRPCCPLAFQLISLDFNAIALLLLLLLICCWFVGFLRSFNWNWVEFHCFDR